MLAPLIQINGSKAHRTIHGADSFGKRSYLKVKPMWNQSFSGYCQRSPLQYSPVCLFPIDFYQRSQNPMQESHLGHIEQMNQKLTGLQKTLHQQASSLPRTYHNQIRFSQFKYYFRNIISSLGYLPHSNFQKRIFYAETIRGNTVAQVKPQTMRHKLMDLGNTTLFEKYVDP